MARKVFMSVLGTSLYDECNYYQNEKENFVCSRFIQEATISLFCNDWTKIDSIIIFTTNQSFSDNYNADINKRFDRRTNSEIDYVGLERILTKLDLKVPFKNVLIKDGNSETEIWEIFETIYSELKEDDEIYFDITHSFRYLPMLLMILLNYSEFLKKTKIKSITYGNFEVSKAQNNFAPIMDLMPLVLLKDWSVAVNNFESFGDVSLISSLCQQSLKPILREAKGADKISTAINSFSKDLPKFVSNLKNCRGPEIISGTLAIDLQKKIENIANTSLAPFNPIFSRLKTQIRRFSSENNVKNGFTAVDWCIHNGLFQQGFTMLQDTIISMVCESEQLDLRNKTFRNIVSSTFNIRYKKTPQNEWTGDCIMLPENIVLTQKLHQNIIVESLLNEFNSLTELRNDINHFGMRSNSAKTESFEKNLKELYCTILAKTCNL